MSANTHTLLDARSSMRGTIVSLPADSALRSQCIRLGLNVGAGFVCIQRLPGGTVVLEASRQEIALGHGLASTIGVVLES